MRALDLLDVDDVAPVEDTEVHRFPRSFPELAENGKRLVAKIELLEESHSQPQVRDAERVEAALPIDAQKAAAREGTQNPMDSGLAVPETRAAFGERQPARAGLADLEKRTQSPVEGLGTRNSLSHHFLRRCFNFGLGLYRVHLACQAG
jgi:hypothetical protein